MGPRRQRWRGRARQLRRRVAHGPAAQALACARPVRNAKRSNLAGAEPVEGDPGINRWRRGGARRRRVRQHRPRRVRHGYYRRGPGECGARMKRAGAVGCDLDARRAGLGRAGFWLAWARGRGAVRRAAGHRGRRHRGRRAGSGETSNAAYRTGKDQREQDCRNLAHRAKSLPAVRRCGNRAGLVLRFILRPDWIMS